MWSASASNKNSNTGTKSMTKHKYKQSILAMHQPILKRFTKNHFHAIQAKDRASMTIRDAKHTTVEWLIFCFCFFLASSLATCSYNETDLRALLAFKENVVDPQGALASWISNGTLHHCSWKGITCGSKHSSRVVAIILDSQGLAGSLSPHLGNLSFLRAINLQNNSFSGLIPQELGRLRRLEYIKFSNNSFEGEIPRNLSQCGNLYFLNLIDNNLVGHIPPELSSLVKLTDLGLTKNNFWGSIPPFFGNFTSLITLALSYNGFHGEIPESLSHLQKLEWLNLGRNQLTGIVPPGVFNISTIELFSVIYNQLSGNIPSNIGETLPNMWYLGLGENKFTGVLPTSLSNATSLTHIGLFNCSFTGPMIKNLNRLPNLQTLSIWSTNVRDDISFISSLTNCTRLTVLDISANSLTGSLPSSIGNLSAHLRLISLGNNQLHGTIPSDIGNLKGLSALSFLSNRLEGPIPSSIGKLSKLQRLLISDNRFTGELPSSLGNLTLLNNLWVVSNGISGSIPPSLGNCSNLLELDFSYNNLSGWIPRELMSLSSLSIRLGLSNNLLSGSIPTEVGHLKNLADLDFSNNRLSGPVPSTIGDCKSLQSLQLHSNSFHGDVPHSLGALSGLRVLDLSRNNFTGTVPSFLVELQLAQLNLSFNQLEGAVPKKGVFQNQSAVSLEGNTGLCGGIPGLKLPLCQGPKKKNSHTLLKILIPTASVAIAAAVLVYMLMRWKSIPRENLAVLSSFDSQFQRLSYADLLRATDGFSASKMIGSGRFGSVYKGTFVDGNTVVAVKVLNLQVRGAFKSFLAECNALRGARHRNLVKILSVSVGTDFKGNDFTALVYQFKSNGSLEKWLHQNFAGPGESIGYLTLMQRLNIAIDIASALEYLHNGTESCIIHGDLKPSNILLDDSMTAYVGDFGLAKVLSNIPSSSQIGDSDNSSVAVKGTIGYIPPEYGMGGTVSTQGDVYSYGILLLELFTNKRPTSGTFDGHSNLHDFVSSALPDRALEIIDPLVLQNESHGFNASVRNTMTTILGAGMACSREVPQDRISMTDVLTQLRRTRTEYQDQGLIT